MRWLKCLYPGNATTMMDSLPKAQEEKMEMRNTKWQYKTANWIAITYKQRQTVMEELPWNISRNNYFTGNITYNYFYFIVSGEISVYLVKIKVISITSELISYHFTCDWYDLYFHYSLWTTSVFFLVSEVDVTSTSYFWTPLTSLFLNKTIKCWYAFS